jgi:hypothetical protein
LIQPSCKKKTPAYLLILDKIDMLLNSAEMRQFRLINKRRKIVKVKVSVFYKQQFYASLRITADRIEVIRFDDEIDTIFFTESHLDGYKRIELEEAKQLDQTIRPHQAKDFFGLKLKFKSSTRSPFIIKFRKKKRFRAS